MIFARLILLLQPMFRLDAYNFPVVSTLMGSGAAARVLYPHPQSSYARRR